MGVFCIPTYENRSSPFLTVLRQSTIIGGSARQTSHWELAVLVRTSPSAGPPAPLGCESMGGTAFRALLALAVVGPLLGWSVRRVQRSPGLQLVGALGLLTVVAAHFCEGLGLFPRMGWGEPRSAGHYLDLSGSVLGLTLIPLGYALSRRH